jgi:uncharacterized protein YjbI with pentapeptide repeats
MANPDHLEILKRSVEEWNQWRKDNLGVKPDLSGAHLEGAHLIGAHLEEADLRWAHLSGAHLERARLERAHLIGAHLEEADLRWADLRWANLRGAHLEGAHLEGASLSKADLCKATLNGISLRRADLTMADLSGADLSGADLSGANLSGANLIDANLSRSGIIGASLSEAKLGGAILQDASLSVSRLINANFDGANLNGAHLWETKRAGWSIKGVICESVYWDEKKEKLDKFEPGDFERLYSEKARVQIKYPGGISTLEIATLPGLIQHLEALHPGVMLRFESVQDAAGGAVVNLAFDDAGDIPPEQIEELRTTIQLEAEQKALFLRQALEGEKQAALLLKGEVQALERTVDKILHSQKPNIYLSEGDLNTSSDTYNISGQAGAVGPNAHAHDMTFNQIGSRIEKSMDLTALASDLEVLRQALKKEATTEEHDIVVADVSKAKKAAEAKDTAMMVEYLKSAGKLALDVATKIGVSLATEAIKHSTGMK